VRSPPAGERMSPHHSEGLSVGDLFCGAGGFAEGFRQAGYRIAWGVDNWEPATTTFAHNFPHAKAICADVLRLDPKSLERVDVLIGSPPCVHFSPANRGGGGDKESGMELVRGYLRLVQELKPRYWIMENVPALRPHLEACMAGDEFRSGTIRVDVPVRAVLDAADFDTPQRRRRLFSGAFPLPATTSGPRLEQKSLRDVTRAFPDPVFGLRAGAERVRDPVYPGLSVQSDKLRDFFEDPRWSLTAGEVESTRERRERDRIYGVMPFPDDLDRPARTVTATKTRGSRATVVLPWPSSGDVPFRTLTLRECASAQGFPLTYQFWGDSMSAKDFLVGNAVPPPIARAIAREILHAEGKNPHDEPILAPESILPEPLVYRKSLGKRFSMKRRFRGSVPVDWRRDHRAELDNELPTVAGRIPEDVMPPVTWRSRLYLGYATLYRCYEVRFLDGLELACRIAGSMDSPSVDIGLAGILRSTSQLTLNGFPDGITLQEEWSGWRHTRLGPRDILTQAARVVEKEFPAALWEGRSVPRSVTDPTLRDHVVSRGKEATSDQPIDASVRLLSSGIVLSLFCERLNVGTHRLNRLHSTLATGSSLRSNRFVDFLSSLKGRAYPSKRASDLLIA
jgi:DNA-cytosine methyltransferase